MRYLTTVLYALCLALLPALSLSAETRFTIQAMMGPGDQEAIGIDKLDPEEQAALEEWINLWTIKTINQVKADNCQCTTEECMSRINQRTSNIPIPKPEVKGSSLEETDYDENRPFNRPERIQHIDPVERIQEKDFNKLTEILRNGGVIRLDNGSTWEVIPSDQNTASKWARYDKVRIEASSVYSRYTMNNLTRKQKIQVTQPGQATHTDPYLNDPFRKDPYRRAMTYNIRNILDSGGTVILDNGGVYEVKMSDRKISRDWAPGTAVEIFKKGGNYPISLKAVLTGDNVQVREKRS